MANTIAKVLLVDDHMDNLTVLEAVLKSDDLQLLKARSGREALEILLAHEIALALIDVQMPEMDGLELAQLMRGTERSRRIPILFITASLHNPQRVFKGYSLGAVDFIFKPVEPHILKTKVDVFVQLHRQNRQIAEQLEEQHEILRLNELLSAAIAHDLRNPLQSIAAGAAVVLQKSSDECIVRSTAERIHASCVRMTKLIEDLLDFSNLRLTGSFPVKPAGTSLLEIVKKVIAEHELADATATINLTAIGDLQGTWDESRMCQAVSNLIGNALNHGDRSEPVTIVLNGAHPDDIVCSVHNKGHIPDSVLPYVFDPFRSSASKGSGVSGLGLGLYIVAQIVKTHGGSIGVDSKPDTGTGFTIELPRHVPGAHQMRMERCLGA
ncbi:MAG TPA: response regulator [Terriglobia bacterium]|jgi:signal transduction histidine kinase